MTTRKMGSKPRLVGSGTKRARVSKREFADFLFAYTRPHRPYQTASRHFVAAETALCASHFTLMKPLSCEQSSPCGARVGAGLPCVADRAFIAFLPCLMQSARWLMLRYDDVQSIACEVAAPWAPPVLVGA